MLKEYVSFEVARLLKEKGFDWPTIEYYSSSGGIYRFADGIADICGILSYPRPTQQMACSWLREEHNIYIETHFIRESGDYVYNIIHSPLALDDIHSFPVVFNTIEDAIEAALEYCLTNLI